MTMMIGKVIDYFVHCFWLYLELVFAGMLTCWISIKILIVVTVNYVVI